MQRYIKEVMLVTFILAGLVTALAAFAAWVYLAVRSPLLGIIIFILLCPFLMRGVEKWLEPEEIY